VSALETTAILVRRVLRAAHGFAVAAGVSCAVVLGGFRSAIARPVLPGILAGVWAVSLALRVRDRRRTDVRRRTIARDLELGLLLVAGGWAALEAAGGPDSAAKPLLFVVVAFVAAFSARGAWIGSAFAGIGLDAAVRLRGGTLDLPRFALDATVLASFAALQLLFTRGEIFRLRRRAREKLEREVGRVREAARDYRLLAAPTAGLAGQGPAVEEQRLVAGSLAEIRQAVHGTLDLLRRTMDLTTAVVLWLDARGDSLKIAELASERDDVLEGPFPAGEGAVAGSVRHGRTVRLDRIEPTFRGLPYYGEPCPARALLVVPVTEGEVVRGALCLDRTAPNPFTPNDEETARAAARTIARAIENERVFAQIERSKAEHVKLYRASQALGSTLSEDDVVEAVLRAAKEIAEHDFAAVTFYDAEAKKHLVRMAAGQASEGLRGLTFGDNAGLVSSAVKVRHYLPYRGEFDAAQQVLFTRKARVEGMRSMLVLPLVVRDEALGAVVLGATRSDAFPEAVRTTLQVLANQMAVSLQNARMYRRLEELATTDGLTGLANHRVFQQELEKKLKSADRFGKKLSLILTDVDHFKGVNDGYGHPVGDEVLRGLGALLARNQRGTDLVARYGGEEFAVICEETDQKGAVQLAERIRQELMAMVFQTEKGPLRVTCSLGIATFPEDAHAKADLVARADQALYTAKHRGRNRSVAAKEIAVAA
jgi:diguanylate cyclase (GGDEF)-like protein